MRPRRFSCNWERKNGAMMMMMSREVHSFTGVCFSWFCSFSVAESLLVRRSARRLQTAAGHNSFNTHLDVIFNVCSWRMKNTADCSSDNYWYSSVYDLFFLLWPPGCFFWYCLKCAWSNKTCYCYLILKAGITALFSYCFDQIASDLNQNFTLQFDTFNI